MEDNINAFEVLKDTKDLIDSIEGKISTIYLSGFIMERIAYYHKSKDVK